MVYSTLWWTLVLGMICGTSFGQTIDACNKINSCSCQNSKGIIDLSPLNTGTPPRFKDVVSSDVGGNSFSWNPCTPFTEGSGSCSNVAVCQIQDGFPRSYIRIGIPGSARFATDNQGILELQYSASLGGVLRMSHITLECDPKNDPGEFIAHGEDPTRLANYYMTYRGVYACPIGSEGDGLSAGSILCIIFFSLILLYLCIGILHQIFIKKASGRESIPQYSFWISLPGLVQACQIQPGAISSYFPIGTQDSAAFVADNLGGLTLTYSATGGDNILRTTVLKLVCDASQDPGTFAAAGEDPSISATYDMTYTGVYACPGAGPSGGGTGGLSVGSILCIAFFALLIVYIAAGVAFQVFIRKASGKEMIPQSSLWLSVPGLIKSCQVQPGATSSYFPIGTQESAAFVADDKGGLTLTYSATGGDSILRTTNLVLVCDASQDPGTLVANGEDPSISATYDLTYTGAYACPVSNTTTPASTTSSPTPSPQPWWYLQDILAAGMVLLACVCLVLTVIILVLVCKRTGENNQAKVDNTPSKSTNYQPFN